MGLFRRLFSADYRAAVAAEAAGDLDLAAERYALAGHHEAAVRVHLARAERAATRADEIAALRDAMHWAPVDGEWRPRVARALGRALLARARAEGVATSRDRERVQEAAAFLMEAGEFLEAGEAYESIGAEQAAARAYSRGGHIDRMESVLELEGQRAERERSLRRAFMTYETELRGGQRDAARQALLCCTELAEDRSEYRRLLDELDARIITSGRVVLRRRQGPPLTICGQWPIALGRDPGCALALGAPGVSRQHAELLCDGSRRLLLRDLGSRNGTLLGGMPVRGAVPLAESGSFALGEHCALSFHLSAAPPLLRLEVAQGIDRGAVLLAPLADQPLPLGGELGLGIAVHFRQGRPELLVEEMVPPLSLGEQPIVRGTVQLIHGDRLRWAGVELEVE